MNGFSLYILRCADSSLYTGIASDVSRRLDEHRLGSRGAKYLRGRQPFELVFEYPVGDRAAAARLECRIKRLSRRQKEDLVAGRLRVTTLVEDTNAGAGQASGDSAG
ncbi:MAG: GIY-YIG nuclease family protein [Proteobacteria bacterium]|nr:GIY-YIG nuclease family protein [Pseudomonadota bacterium]